MNNEQLEKLYDLRDRYDTLATYNKMHFGINEKVRIDVLYKQAKEDYFNYMREMNEKKL